MLIEGRDITYRYAGEPVPVLSGLCFSINGPGFISLFGLSGTGKSTAARIISGELIPETGTVDIPGGSTVLYSHDSERLPGWCSVGEHIESVTPPTKRPLMTRLISEFGMDFMMDRWFRELSMGQKNRANLLRYLVQDFDMLIADEVLANVDELTRDHILALIKSCFPSKIFLYISHNAIEVARFSKKILVLPVNTSEGLSMIQVIRGLDMTQDKAVSQKALRDTVMNLLQTAASGRAFPSPGD